MCSGDPDRSLGAGGKGGRCGGMQVPTLEMSELRSPVLKEIGHRNTILALYVPKIASSSVLKRINRSKYQTENSFGHCSMDGAAQMQTITQEIAYRGL